MKPLTTAQLLHAGANTIERDANAARASCNVAGRDWACRECATRPCPTRARWALDARLVTMMRERAEQLDRMVDPLGEALNSGDGSYRP